MTEDVEEKDLDIDGLIRRECCDLEGSDGRESLGVKEEVEAKRI
jgi:hypothetical protein